LRSRASGYFGVMIGISSLDGRVVSGVVGLAGRGMIPRRA
jgi:hypothetical protein